ncbi:MAG: hypothetical protein V4650_05700 [Pseudomonadota bacterium]
MYALIVIAHVAVGGLALAAYWTAGLSKKGSPLHRKAGWLFMLMMLLVLATSVVFVARMVDHEALSSAAFFAYLIVISATALVTGWFSLQLKRDHARYHGRWYQALAVFNIVCGAGVLLLGIRSGQAVLMGFSLVGLVRGAAMLRLARQPEQPRWWLREHLGSMIGNGVAVHVAFLLVGLKRLLPEGWGVQTELVGWLLPLTVAGIAGVVFGRRYAVKPVSASVTSTSA